MYYIYVRIPVRINNYRVTAIVDLGAKGNFIANITIEAIRLP